MISMPLPLRMGQARRWLQHQQEQPGKSGISQADSEIFLQYTRQQIKEEELPDTTREVLEKYSREYEEAVEKEKQGVGKG
ncbi:MAG: hypothetical protein Q9218_007017, partial [Villophora microphyllina]